MANCIDLEGLNNQTSARTRDFRTCASMALRDNVLFYEIYTYSGDTPTLFHCGIEQCVADRMYAIAVQKIEDYATFDSVAMFVDGVQSRHWNKER